MTASPTNPDTYPALKNVRIEREEGTIQTTDGLHLSWWSLYPRNENDDNVCAFANLIFTHGYDDYTDRYAHFLHYLAERGVYVYALDVRGHGKSEGPRSLISSFDEYTSDYNLFVDFVKEKKDDALPLFIAGHSNGGLILAKSLIGEEGLKRQEGIAGAVFFSPYIKMAVEVDFFTNFGARLANVFNPKFMIDNPVCGDITKLTNDPNLKIEPFSDTTSSGKVSIRWVVESERAQKEVLANAADIVLPLIVLFGGDDPVASPAACRELFCLTSSKDKTLVEYPGLRHELPMEIDKDKVATKLLSWLHEKAEMNMSLVSSPHAHVKKKPRSSNHVKIDESITPDAKRRRVKVTDGEGDGEGIRQRERTISASSEASHEFKEALVAAAIGE